MTPPNTPNDGTVADKTRLADLVNSFMSKWVVVSDNSDDTTNVNTPKTSIVDTNGDGLSMSCCCLESSSEGHTPECLADSSEGIETGKDNFDSLVQSWVLCAIGKDGVAKEKNFYLRSSSEGAMWRYFLATYANGAEKKVRLDLESASYRLTQMTPADGTFVDGSGDRFDGTVEGWAIDVIYASGKRQRLYPDSIHDDKMPIANWHICTYQTNGNFEDLQLYPEVCFLESTPVNENPQSQEFWNRATSARPILTGESTIECSVADENEQPISIARPSLGEPEEETTQFSRESSVTLRGDNLVLCGVSPSSDDSTRSGEDVSTNENAVRDVRVDKCRSISVDTDDEPEGGDDDESERGDESERDDESESDDESERDDEEVHTTKGERVKRCEKVRAEDDHSQKNKALEVDCRLRIRNENVNTSHQINTAITTGSSTKHARDNTPCDGEPWFKRQKIQIPTLDPNTAHIGDKSIWQQSLFREWTHDDFYWDYLLTGSREQLHNDDSGIISRPGAAFSEAAIKKIHQALMDSVGPSFIANKLWDWEYMVGEKNMFHRRGYIRFKYTSYHGLQIENLQYRPVVHPVPRVTDDLARDFVQSIFSIAGLKVYQSLCDRTNFVDDGSCEKFVYSSDAYTSADANRDWECLPAKAHRLGTDVYSLEEAWNLGELFYLPGTKGFRAALWPNSRYCKGKIPSSIPALTPQNACRLLDNIFHALKPLGHHKWPRIVRRRQDDNSCLYFYGKSGQVRFTGDQESSEKALKLLWLMCGDRCEFNQRVQFDPDAKDLSAIATTGYGIMDLPNDNAMALPDTKEDALPLEKNYVESLDFIEEECRRFETPRISGCATGENDSHTRDSDDNALMERRSETVNGNADRDWDKNMDGGQHKDDPPTLSNRKARVYSRADTSTYETSDSESTKSQEPVQTLVPELNEVPSKDNTFQRQIREEGWEKLSSSETSKQVSDEIMHECRRRRDLHRWCELSIPDFETSNTRVVWEAVITYEQSISLYERLAKRFVEPNQLLSWFMAGATWEFALRENMLAGFLSIGYQIGKGLELSFLGTKRASRSAVALLLDLFGCREYPGRSKPYTKEDAVKDWEFGVSEDDVSAFDDADCTFDGWGRWDYTQLCSLKGEKAFIVVPKRDNLPSDTTELLPPSAQDSRRIYDRLKKTFRKASAPLDTPYDENWTLAISRVQDAHGEKFVPSRLLFEGREGTGGTCGFVFEGKACDTFVALRLIWSLLGDDWEGN